MATRTDLHVLRILKLLAKPFRFGRASLIGESIQFF
jgi:hypothetical protein